MMRILFFLFCLPTLVMAGFSKYRTPTQYNQPKTPETNSQRAPAANKPAATPTPARKPAQATKDIFGRAPKTDATLRPKKDSPFVTLNPETGYGPEVITSFDFPNADIAEVTKHMQKLTGINLITDKDLKGKVSLTAPSPITVGDAWKAYLAALTLNGFTIVKAGEFYKILKVRDLRDASLKVYTGKFTPDLEQFVISVIKLKHVNAKQAKTEFRSVLSKNARILAVEDTNSLILYDTGSKINNLQKLLKFIDVPGFKETLHFIKVKYTSAQELAKLLEDIQDEQSTSRFRRRRSSASNTSNTGSSISKIIAEPRTNSIIAKANAQGAKELRALVDKLDVKLVAGGSDKVHVYYLNHGNSEELSKTLSTIITGQTPASTPGNSSSRSSRSSSRFSSGNVASNDSLFNADVKVTSDKGNNALVITATPSDWDTLKGVIAKLDIPRDQVYVEGLIMETRVKKGDEFGISILGAYGTGAAQKTGINAADAISLLTNDITSLGGIFGAGFGGSRDIQVGDQTITVNSVNAALKAIATNDNTDVLATPQILAMDNEEAIFEVGEEVPRLTQTLGNTTSQVSAEKDTVSLKLKITPRINKASRFVTLKIDQQIQDFSNTPLPESLRNVGVAKTIRNAVTTVSVRDRDTIAMGGLMRDKMSDGSSKVPLLGDIPVLGWLFKRKKKDVEKVNLLLFMTPRILDTYEETAAATTKDALNRRSAHLKNIHGEDDPFASTVKGLYKKVQAQAQGPLYKKKGAASSTTLPKLEGETTLYTKEQWEALAKAELDVPDYRSLATARTTSRKNRQNKKRRRKTIEASVEATDFEKLR